jgi:alkanesulfonate monooxygenase SsuD/methylene tetrahydromethanopterin reductase-like flavin-dependent oxidoreductase (luciferase family)
VSTVADELTRYVRAGAINDLNLVPNAVPGGFDDVVDRLVPALQEHLGLRAPVAHRVPTYH